MSSLASPVQSIGSHCLLQSQSVLAIVDLADILQRLREQPDLILGTEGISRSSIKRKREQAVNVDGYLGSVLRQIKFSKDDGSTVAASYLDPAAFLDLMVSRCESMKAFWAAQGERHPGCWDLALYLDEVTPGNPLKPLNRRKVWAVYYSYFQLGRAMLQRMVYPFAHQARRSCSSSGRYVPGTGGG